MQAYQWAEKTIKQMNNKNAVKSIAYEWERARTALHEVYDGSNTISLWIELGTVEKMAKEGLVDLPKEFLDFKASAYQRLMKNQLYELRKSMKSKETHSGSYLHDLMLLEKWGQEGGITLPNGFKVVRKFLQKNDIDAAYVTLSKVFPEVNGIREIVVDTLKASPDAVMIEPVFDEKRKILFSPVNIMPEKETYDLKELQDFMEGLIPFGLEPNRQRDFETNFGWYLLGGFGFSNVEEGSSIDVKIYPSEAVYRGTHTKEMKIDFENWEKCQKKQQTGILRKILGK